MKVTCTYPVYCRSVVLLLQIWIFLRFAEEVETSVVASCSFENDTAKMCGWTKPSWSDGAWVRSAGSTNPNTGPELPEDIIGGDQFIMLDSVTFKNNAGLVQAGKTVTLLTPKLPRVTCMVFLYMKHGKNTGVLRVGVSNNGTISDEISWNKLGDTNASWHCQAVRVNVTNQAIFIQAESGPNELGDIAVDEIFLFNDTCPTPTDCLPFLTSRGPLPTTSTSTLPTTSTLPITSFSGNSSTYSSASAVISPSHRLPQSSLVSSVTDGTSSASVRATAATTPTSEGEETSIDTIILASTIIPVVVLLVAAVAAVVCYRRRISRSRRTNTQPKNYDRSNPQFSAEEVYDVISNSDTTTDHYDKIQDSSGGSVK